MFYIINWLMLTLKRQKPDKKRNQTKGERMTLLLEKNGSLVFHWGDIVLYNADFVLIRQISKIFLYVLHYKLVDTDFKKANLVYR